MFRIMNLVALVVSMVTAGCAGYSESYLVGVKTGKYGDQMEPAQFYRLDLSGSVMFQRTEFQCGWYDRNAVDQLFSEVVTETSARNAASGGATAPTVAKKSLSDSTKESSGESSYTVYGPEGVRLNADGKRFVIIAANNPKTISDQIEALASSQEAGAAIAALLQREQRAAALEAKRALDDETGPQKAVMAILDSVMVNLKKVQTTSEGLTAENLLSELGRAQRSLQGR